MTIKQLEYFIGLVNASTFTEAAENMYISQSSLSKQLKSLEDEIGIKLMTRTTRNIQLTAAGTDFVKYASNILHIHDKMMNAMRVYTDMKQVSLRISTIPVASNYRVIEYIMSFRRIYPEIDTIVEEQDTSVAFRLLLNKKIDMCIMRSYFITDERCRAIPLVMDELVMITSRDHPFARQGEISLAEAANEYFFLLGKQTGLYNYCIDLCNAAGFTPITAKQVFRLDTIQDMVVSNKGVSLVMLRVAKQFRNNKLSIVTLKEHPTMDLSIVVRNEDYGDAARQFIDFMCSCFGASSNI